MVLFDSKSPFTKVLTFCVSVRYGEGSIFALFPSAKLHVKILPSPHIADNQQIRTEMKEEFILFSPKNLAILQFICTFAVEFQTIRLIGRWCNGNTTGFGSVIPGSNPSRPTTKKRGFYEVSLFVFYP